MQKLTAMQQRIYDYIASFIRDQGYPPSVREIGEAVGLKSPSTVHFHIKHLEELGYRAVQAQPVDLFPRTAHVETVLRMERRNR